jgi:hypothetical protein
VLIALGLVAGLFFAVRQRSRAERVAQLTAPIALLVASLALLVITALNRADFGADWARQSRYVSLVAAMSLPALALGADAVATRWPRALPVVCVLFLLGIPANINVATRAQRDILRPRDAATRDTMLSLPLDPIAPHVPRSVHPEPTTATAITIGWLLDQAGAGRLAKPGPLTPRLRSSNAFRLSFDRPDGPIPTTNCRSIRRPFTLDLHEGDRFSVLDAPIYLEPVPRTLVGVDPLYPAAANAPIVVVRDVGTIRIIPASGDTARVCRSPRQSARGLGA